MSRIVGSRLLSHLSKKSYSCSRPFCSNVSANPSKETIISSQSLLNDQSSVPPPSDATPKKKSWNFLKFGVVGALTAAAGTAGYATYAYSLEDVNQKTASLRDCANYTVGDDASVLENWAVTECWNKTVGVFCMMIRLNRTVHSMFLSSSFIRRRTPCVLWIRWVRLKGRILKKIQARLYSTAMTVPAKAVELYIDIRRSIEEQIRGFTDPSSDKLLPDLHPLEQHVFTLVLDLNETLIYSDWKRDRGWRTFKRPGVDAFLEHLAQFYEIVVYSDQLNMYVDPIIERLDQKGCIRYRLSRAATRYLNGKHYRDLSKLNRDPAHILYVSGHALESSLQPENSVAIKPWKLEADDTALLDLIPFLEYVARHRPADIRPVLASYQGRDIATEFIERSKEHQRRMLEQKQQNRFWRR